MKLTIDVGNTHTVIGRVEDKQIVDKYRIHTVPEDTGDELWMKLEGMLGSLPQDIQLLVASVVPEVSTAIKDMGEHYLSQDPWFLRYPWSDSGVVIQTDDPREVGADRVACATACYDKYGEGIVVDFGTATTLDVIDAKGSYLGGVIFPGLRASAVGLHTKAAKLPLVSPRTPSEFSGSNTKDSLRTGLFFGITGAVERLIDGLKDNYPISEEVTIVGTGGAASAFCELTEKIDKVDQDLVLEGLVKSYPKK